MKLRKDLSINIALALLVATCVLMLCHETDFFKRLELFSLDLSFQLKGSHPYQPGIVIIEISDYDIAKIGQWPWPRSWHAAVTKALSDMGAKAIYFDILFAEPSTEKDDLLLEQAVKGSEKVYLPFAFRLPATDMESAYFPLKRFEPYLKGTGAINIFPDIDGVMRRIPLIFGTDRGYQPHVVMKIALDYMGEKIVDVKPSYILLEGPRGAFKVPTDEKHQLLINWPGRWKNTFRHYSFMDVLTSYKDIIDGQEPHIKADDIKDSICIIGATAIGLCDIKNVPCEPSYPGLGVMASALDNLLGGKLLYVPPAWVGIVILYLLSILPAFIMVGEKPFREMIIIMAIAIVYLFTDIVFLKSNLRLELFTPLFGLSMSALVIGTYDFVRVALERKRFFKMAITDGLTSLYNVAYFKMNVSTEVMFAKADKTKKFSIIMTDVDHFKKFNDTYGHQVGDLVLKSVAATLKNSVRGLDVVARYGGEEMIILLRGTALAQAMDVAEKVRKNVENCVVQDEKNTYKVTISLGVSDFQPSDDVDTIIKRADEGLYLAKESGRNRVGKVEPHP